MDAPSRTFNPGVPGSSPGWLTSLYASLGPGTFPQVPWFGGNWGKPLSQLAGLSLAAAPTTTLGSLVWHYFLYSGSRFILHYRKDVAVAVLRERGAGVPQAP